MAVKARVAEKPLLDPGRLVRAVVVEDQMAIEVRWDKLLDVPQEADEIATAVAAFDLADHPARGDIQRRVHQHAAGSKRGGPDGCMGRSRGGLTTKIHAVVDATGLTLRFALSPGQAHDSTLTGPLLDDHLPADGFMLADKAYDTEWIRAMIETQDAVPIIPDRSTAKTPHAFSRDLYRPRNRVEHLFNKLKQFRPIETRYEKLAANYLAIIKIATIRIWLRANEPTP